MFCTVSTLARAPALVAGRRSTRGMTVTSLRVAVLLVLTFAGLASAADQRPNLLVLDLEPRGVGLPEAQAATGSVVRGLRQLDVFQVLSSDDVRQLLALERTRQLSGARAESSVGQLGAALNAPNAVVGSVTRAARDPAPGDSGAGPPRRPGRRR